MTIEDETPSCEGCSLRCGFRQERSELIEKSMDLTSQDLILVVTKIYGGPLMVLLVVLFFESVVFSVDSIALLFILLLVLLPSIFFMAGWARKDIFRKIENQRS